MFGIHISQFHKMDCIDCQNNKDLSRTQNLYLKYLFPSTESGSDFLQL